MSNVALYCNDGASHLIALQVLLNSSPIFADLHKLNELLCEGGHHDPLHFRVTVNEPSRMVVRLIHDCVMNTACSQSRHTAAVLAVAVALAPVRARQCIIKAYLSRMDLSELCYHFQEALKRGYPTLVKVIALEFLRHEINSFAGISLSHHSVKFYKEFYAALQKANGRYLGRLFLDRLPRDVLVGVSSLSGVPCSCGPMPLLDRPPQIAMKPWVKAYISCIRDVLQQMPSLSALRDPHSLAMVYYSVPKGCRACAHNNFLKNDCGDIAIRPGSDFELFVHALHAALVRVLDEVWDTVYAKRALGAH